MRVAYVCSDPGIPVLGAKGASVHVQEVIRALLRRGHDVDLVAARLGGEVPADLRRVRIHRLPAAGGATLAERERSAKAAADVASEVLAGLGRVDLVYERYSLWSRGATAWAARHHVPSVVEVNAPLPDEQVRHRQLHHVAAARHCAQATFARADLVVAVSAPVAAWAAAMGAVEPLVVPNGVDVERFRPRPPGRRSRDPYTIGFVGTLKSWHGVDVLVEAFRLLQPAAGARLLLVGDGPERARLEARLRDARVRERAELVGAVRPAEVAAWLARMDVAVAPYPASATYFSPLKLFEYLAAGLPVVASAVGQAAEVLEHRRTGLLCPPEDPPALAAALDELRHDPALGAALGAAGRRLVERHHTWAAVVDRILAASEARWRAGEATGTVPAGRR